MQSVAGSNPPILAHPLHQEIDRLTGESTKNATFDVVRMAQAITWPLDNTTIWEQCGNHMGTMGTHIGSLACPKS